MTFSLNLSFRIQIGDRAARRLVGADDRRTIDNIAATVRTKLPFLIYNPDSSSIWMSEGNGNRVTLAFTIGAVTPGRTMPQSGMKEVGKYLLRRITTAVLVHIDEQLRNLQIANHEHNFGPRARCGGDYKFADRTKSIVEMWWSDTEIWRLADIWSNELLKTEVAFPSSTSPPPTNEVIMSGQEAASKCFKTREYYYGAMLVTERHRPGFDALAFLRAIDNLCTRINANPFRVRAIVLHEGVGLVGRDFETIASHDGFLRLNAQGYPLRSQSASAMKKREKAPRQGRLDANQVSTPSPTEALEAFAARVVAMNMECAYALAASFMWEAEFIIVSPFGASHARLDTLPNMILGQMERGFPGYRQVKLKDLQESLAPDFLFRSIRLLLDWLWWGQEQERQERRFCAVVDDLQTENDVRRVKPIWTRFAQNITFRSW